MAEVGGGAMFVLCLILWMQISIIQADPCRGASSDVIACGGPRYRWSFCFPRTPERKIISVHLLLNYPFHPNCKPTHFGLTLNHDRMWVQGWCFGSFLVCLAPEMTTKTVTMTTTMPASFATRTFTSDRKKATSKGTVIPSSTTGYRSELVTTDSKRTSPGPVLQNHVTSETVTGSSESMASSTAYGTVLPAEEVVSSQNNSTLNSYRHSDPDYGALPMKTLNVLIVLGICTGGVFLALVLISATVLIVVRRHRSALAPRRRTDSSDDEIPSTASLVTSVNDVVGTSTNQASVYDFIPFDKDTRLPEIPGRFRLLDTPPPDRKMIHIYSRTYSESEYDHLFGSRRSEPSPTSNYNHVYQFESVYDHAEACKRTERLISISENEYSVLVEQRPIAD